MKQIQVKKIISHVCFFSDSQMNVRYIREIDSFILL